MLKPDENRPTDWFEPLYAASNINGDGVPWANGTIHPYFKESLELQPLKGKGRKAMVVGCGLGDDAVALEKMGFEVKAFDVSVSAIQLCQERFPDSKVSFQVADLFNYPLDWKHSFDFVLEIYTIQALPPRYEALSIQKISELVSEKGTLLVISQVNEAPRNFENGPPWLLTPDHRMAFQEHHLMLTHHLEKKTVSGLNQVYFSWFKRAAISSDPGRSNA